jgi:hypothetical protein
VPYHLLHCGDQLSGGDRYTATTCYRTPHKPLLLLSVMDHIAAPADLPAVGKRF